MKTMKLAALTIILLALLHKLEAKTLKLADSNTEKRATWLITRRNSNTNSAKPRMQKPDHMTTAAKKGNSGLAPAHDNILNKAQAAPFQRITLHHRLSSDAQAGTGAETRSRMGHFMNGRTVLPLATATGRRQRIHSNRKLAREVRSELQRRLFLSYGPTYRSRK